MQIFLRNWYAKFFEELAKTSHLRVISPFVKEQLLRNVGEKFDLNKFELITRFNLADFALNVSSLNALKYCVQSGSSVFGIRELHSKVYLFDKRTAIITSANLTNGGLINNYECGLFLDDSKIVGQLHSHFEDLKLIAESPLTSSQIEQWEHELNSVDIPNKVAVSLPDYGASQVAVDNNRRYFVKFFGTSVSRIPLSSSTRAEIERTLCHYACTFSENKKPRQFRDGDVIYISRITHSPNDFAIYGRAEAVHYEEARDSATAEEIEQRPWKRHWPIYLRTTNPVFIEGTMGDCVLLYDLINELDYLSFASTKKRFEEGERDIRPARSLTQQPYVELTPQAAEWLESRFQDALQKQGSVASEFLDSLPQSAINL